MNDENIRDELKEIVKKLDRIRKLNDDIRFLLILIVIILIVFAFWVLPYFLR